MRRAKAAFLSGCESHPVMLLQPEAIGAVMEVLHVLAYNLKHVMNILGIKPLIQAIQA